jgi:hypothetical protein
MIPDKEWPILNVEKPLRNGTLSFANTTWDRIHPSALRTSLLNYSTAYHDDDNDNDDNDNDDNDNSRNVICIILLAVCQYRFFYEARNVYSRWV